MNRHKKLIKDAYDGKFGAQMCDDWKDIIEQHYPEFKQVKEDLYGCWIKDDRHPLWMMFLKDGYGFGFNSYGNWFDKEPCCYYPNKNPGNRKATRQEIEEALSKEAIKRGFVKGVYFDAIKYNDGLSSGCIYKQLGDTFVYSLDMDVLCGSANVYAKGNWAKIVETITKEEAEKQLNCKIL